MADTAKFGPCAFSSPSATPDAPLPTRTAERKLPEKSKELEKVEGVESRRGEAGRGGAGRSGVRGAGAGMGKGAGAISAFEREDSLTLLTPLTPNVSYTRRGG